MGGMKFDNIQQCGMRCKELGPMTSISMAPSSNYVEVTHKAKQQFFASDVDKERYEYFLADPQGSKLTDTINRKPWNLSEYQDSW